MPKLNPVKEKDKVTVVVVKVGVEGIILQSSTERECLYRGRLDPEPTQVKVVAMNHASKQIKRTHRALLLVKAAHPALLLNEQMLFELWLLVILLDEVSALMG